jgi:hypothetical protein
MPVTTRSQARYSAPDGEQPSTPLGVAGGHDAGSPARSTGATRRTQGASGSAAAAGGSSLDSPAPQPDGFATSAALGLNVEEREGGRVRRVHVTRPGGALNDLYRLQADDRDGVPAAARDRVHVAAYRRMADEPSRPQVEPRGSERAGCAGAGLPRVGERPCLGWRRDVQLRAGAVAQDPD